MVTGDAVQPLVSCLMPTMPGREAMAKLAVQDFINQDWENKQLVVACSGEYDTIAPFFSWVESLNHPQICTVFEKTQDGKPLPLGAMRNFTNDVADGDWLCTWDDDDRSHPSRINMHMQTAADKNADISYLNMQLHCFPDIKRIYWVDWQSHRSPGYVCYRKTSLRYRPELGVEEDKYFLRELDAAGYTFAKVETLIPVYIRYYHGTNAWNRRHHEVLVHGHAVAPSRLSTHKHLIADFLRLMGIAGPLDVMSRSTLVFRYN